MNFIDLISSIKQELPPYRHATIPDGIYRSTETVLNHYLDLIMNVDDKSYASIHTIKAEVIENIKSQL